MQDKKTLDFIDKAQKKHGNKYEYSYVSYLNANSKITIICPEHGVFSQKASSHLSGHGCKKCGQNLITQKLKTAFTYSLEQFFDKLIAKGHYNDQYDYSKFVYVKSGIKSIIIDKKYGTEHLITPNALIQTNAKCSIENAADKTLFCIKQFEEVHGNKYDYSLMKYTNEKTKVIIICPEHGKFSQTPDSHRKGSGCVYCYRENKSKIKICLSYKEAKLFLHNLNLKSSKEYNEWFKANKPDNLPGSPSTYYKNDGWISMGDYLGTGKIADQHKVYWEFDKARTFVHSLGFKSSKDYKEYCKSKDYNINLPKVPSNTYLKKGWCGFSDFLGVDNKAPRSFVFLDFLEARKIVHLLKLNNKKEWSDYLKTNKIKNIPANPSATYKNKGWISWGDWLGTGYVKTSDRNYLPYEEAKLFVHTLNFTTEDEWREYCKSGLKPNNIPSNPQIVYGAEFIGQPDWLGYEKIRFLTKYKINMLNKLEHTDLLTMDPFEIYTIIGQGKIPVDFGTLANTDAGSEERVTTLRELKERFSSDEQTEDIDAVEPVLIEDIIDAELVPVDDVDSEIEAVQPEPRLPHMNLLGDLHSLDNNIYATMDKEAFESLIQYKLRKLWNSVLNNDVTIESLQNETGGEYFTTIKNLFIAEYDEVSRYQPKKGYSFKFQPNLMQKLSVLRLLKNKSYGNWSGTGAGKTLSFIVASREIDAKLTIIIALNSTIKQTCKSIKETYSDSKIYTNYQKGFIFDRTKHNYLVLNYEKFQQEYSEGLFQDLTNNNQIDFVVIDEVHNAKQRQEDDESKRREVMNRLLGRIREKNTNLYTMVMSATPVVNNLYEAKSLLQLMTGLDYNDIDTRRTLGNALKIFQQLILNGLRFIPKYDIEMSELTGSNMTNLNIDGGYLLETILELPQSNYIAIEKLLLDDKLKAITPYLRKGVILYSYFTTGFINEIETYVKSQGFSIGTYTGEESPYIREENLAKFIVGDLDILIGSRPIGTGVDGLQEVSNRMILLTLPWTDSEYTQLKGRIYRQGSLFGSIEIIIPQVRINLEDGDFWSWDVQRLNVIKNKKTLADAAVDGIVPSRVLPTANTMFKKSQESLQRWKDRVNSGNLIELTRNNMQINLYPEIDNVEQRQARIQSELSEFNRRGKTTKSSTMHKEFTDNPDSWFRYHALRKERMGQWDEVPYEYIATKIRNRNHKVIDFGCGENLFKNCIPHNEVISFDHVSHNGSIACDMKDVSQWVGNESVDVCVFSLALWGTNYKDYITEAYRTLNYGGVIHIAEPAKDYETPELEEELKTLIEEVGFKVVGVVERRSKFIYITGIKM